MQRKKLLLRGRTSPHLNDYFWMGDREDLQNRASAVRYDQSGYVYAFTDPPYTLLGTTEEINDLFVAIVNEIFDGFRSDCTIFQRSTDWTIYFNAGNEWWGSFLWTVYSHDSSFIVGIAASATD
ncbi:MAG: hypothetical protein F6K28_38525 [Microcoleus sp. SIO2G3]|nr:hypothetical protein [Microcoleus sp. SIO2G3]